MYSLRLHPTSTTSTILIPAICLLPNPPPPPPPLSTLSAAWAILASTPGSLSYAEREPGTHCLRMRQNSQKYWEFGYHRKLYCKLVRICHVHWPYICNASRYRKNKDEWIEGLCTSTTEGRDCRHQQRSFLCPWCDREERYLKVRTGVGYIDNDSVDWFGKSMFWIVWMPFLSFRL